MTKTTGTLIDGSVKLDEIVDLPNNIRVNVSLQPIVNDPLKAIAAWDRLQKRLSDRPVNSEGTKFTRDELHDRN